MAALYLADEHDRPEARLLRLVCNERPGCDDVPYARRVERVDCVYEAEVEDVVGAIPFLESAPPVTGELLRVDGCRSAGR